MLSSLLLSLCCIPLWGVSFYLQVDLVRILADTLGGLDEWI